MLVSLKIWHCAERPQAEISYDKWDKNNALYKVNIAEEAINGDNLHVIPTTRDIFCMLNLYDD